MLACKLLDNKICGWDLQTNLLVELTTVCGGVIWGKFVDSWLKLFRELVTIAMLLENELEISCERLREEKHLLPLSFDSNYQDSLTSAGRDYFMPQVSNGNTVLDKNILGFKHATNFSLQYSTLTVIKILNESPTGGEYKYLHGHCRWFLL